MNPKLGLVIPYPCAEDAGGTKPRRVATEIGALTRTEEHPVADEFFNTNGHTEELPKNGSKAFGVADLTDQRAGVKQFCQVGNRIAIAQNAWCDPNERANVRRIPIVVRTIAVDMRLRLRPGAVKQRQKSM